MSFAVVWEPSVAAKIEADWDSAAEPRQLLIEQSLERIAVALREEPLSIGESRKMSIDRVITEPPVTVFYRVIERLNLVRVYAARVYSQP